MAPFWPGEESMGRFRRASHALLLYYFCVYQEISINVLQKNNLKKLFITIEKESNIKFATRPNQISR